MRSTVDLEDATMHELKELAARQHKTLKVVLTETLNTGFGRIVPTRPQWKCEFHDLGGGFDYSRAWVRIDDLEADAVAEKKELRK